MVNVPIREYNSTCLNIYVMKTKMTGAHITHYSLTDIQKNEDYTLACNPRHFRIFGVAAPAYALSVTGLV